MKDIMLSPDQRSLIEHTRRWIGDPTRVQNWDDDSGDISIPIATVPNSPGAGLTSYSTLGLSNFDDFLSLPSGQPLRAEFVMAAASGNEAAESGLSNCALNLATGEYQARPGFIYPNVFAGYSDSITTPHALLWTPYAWDKEIEGLDLEVGHVEWLQIVPITTVELDFVALNGPGPEGEGVDRLIDAFEANETIMWDFNRRSAV